MCCSSAPGGFVTQLLDVQLSTSENNNKVSPIRKTVCVNN